MQTLALMLVALIVGMAVQWLRTISAYRKSPMRLFGKLEKQAKHFDADNELFD